MRSIIFIVGVLSAIIYSPMFAQTTTNLGSQSGTSGIDNVFIGYEAGELNTAERNVFIGSQAGEQNSAGAQNVFLGFMAGSDNTSGNANVFVGNQAGAYNTTGEGNIALGTQAAQKNTTGNRNTMMGHFSGRQNKTGIKNAFFGHYAGQSNISGDFNVFIGNQTGYANTVGEHNLYLGSEAGYNSSGSKNVFIGYKSGYNELGDDKLYIDNTDTSTPLLYGDFNSNQLGVNTNTIPANYAFAVKGKVMAEEITVKVFPWADFVFMDNYELPTLDEVEKFIKENGHLEHIPSAKIVAENGLDLGKMDSKLLQKIEELTLYTIHQEKQITEQELRISELEKLITKLIKE